MAEGQRDQLTSDRTSPCVSVPPCLCGLPAFLSPLVRRLGVAALCLSARVPLVAAADPVAVEMVNASRKTGCAEEDNVYVKFLGIGVTGFRLAVRHPPYIAEVTTDSTAPDFSRCDMSHDPSFPFTPRDVTLFDYVRYK